MQEYKVAKIFNYTSDLNSLAIIRKKFTYSRFQYVVEDSKLKSITFNIDKIRPNNSLLFQKILKILSFSNQIQELKIHISSFSIEKDSFIELLQQVFSIKNVKQFSFFLRNLNSNKEIFGYFTKFLILSLRNLTYLNVDFSNNSFGDDGVLIFGLGMVNLTSLRALKLNFSNTKMKGSGLLILLENITKELELFEIICESCNEIQQDGNIFQNNFLLFLKKLKKFTNLNSISLNFAKNCLEPRCLIKTLELFLQNKYFDKLSKLVLNFQRTTSLFYWEIFAPVIKDSKRTKKTLDYLDLNLSENEIRDCDFRHFYDILILFHGLKYVSLNFRNNLFKQFRSNIFFIFSSIAFNPDLQSVSLDLDKNFTVKNKSFSVNGEHIPYVDSLKSLVLKTALPDINNIHVIFADFLKRFRYLEKLSICLQFPIDMLEFSFIVKTITEIKKLKFLHFDLRYKFPDAGIFKQIIEFMKDLHNLVELQLFFRYSIAENAEFLRFNMIDFLDLSLSCTKLQFLSLHFRENEIKTDHNYYSNLVSLVKHFLRSHKFLIIKTNESVSRLFRTKLARLYIATVLKNRLQALYKRKLILSEILDCFT